MRSISADYSQNPQQKVSFFLLRILSLIVSSSRRMLPFDVWPSFPVTTWTLPYADFGKTIVLTTQRSQTAIFFRTFSMVFNCRSLFNEAAYLAALRGFVRHLQSVTPTRNNQRQKYMKTNHLLLRISAVIGRFGPHLIICDDICDPK